MADARALLRAERAARQQPQPKSTQPQAVQPTATKKRKSPTEETLDGEEGRKRTKEAHVSQQPIIAEVNTGLDRRQAEQLKRQDALLEVEEEASALVSVPAATANGSGSADVIQDVDEDEWAAFERDVATPSPPPAAVAVPKSAIQALNSSTAISAAPTTTKKDAALDRRKEEQRLTREQREEEVAADKEDAVRNLEEEFEEMDALEARVRKLRERRELLRSGDLKATGEQDSMMNGDAGDDEEEGMGNDSEQSEVDESDDDDIDDDAAWGFGHR